MNIRAALQARIWEKAKRMKCRGIARQYPICLLAALAVGMASLGAQADDIDVYSASAISGGKPNILFVLDFSGSMAWDTSGVDNSRNNGPRRIDVLKEAMDQVLDNNVNTINAGLGSTYSEGTTGIRWPVSDLSAKANTVDANIPDRYTVKDIIKQRINERDAAGWTSTVDALVEAAQYFRGDPVTHNDSSVVVTDRHRPATWSQNRNRYTGGNDNASLSSTYSPSDAYTKGRRNPYICNDYSGAGGPNFCADKRVSDCKPVSANDTKTTGYERFNNLWGDYRTCEYKRNTRWQTPRFNSPITNTCGKQSNAIVLITDGEPTRINNGTSLRSVIPNGDIAQCRDMTSLFIGSRWTTNQGNCAIEVVNGLAKEDVYLQGSRVKTYTVGFNINNAGQRFLNELSRASETRAYSASDPVELAAALADIVTDIQTGSENFAELAVEVDRASFSHNDRVFYSLFSPSKRRSWQGNLKGYFVEKDGLVGINGKEATTDNVFNTDVQSFWSATTDGNIVEKGGASEKLLTGARNLYTYVEDELSEGAVALTGSDNTVIHTSNNKITNAMLGLENDSTGTSIRKLSLDWLQNAPMGDALHTKSVGVNYGSRQVRFVMTNQGLLHAFDVTAPTEKALGDDTIDTTGGKEIFAFMPKRLLKNLPEIRLNSSDDGHIYGLDGAMTRWHDDKNRDGVVDEDEPVTLYFGMRRGGSAYYAMDINDPDKPKLKWVIDETTAGFERLAQSWSRMSLITVQKGAEKQDGSHKKRVLAFAAGYDALAQDDVNKPMESKGNAIYMVGEDGKLVWHVDVDDNEHMKYSIASDLTLIDSDGDSLADRLYVGDLGGQVWRVDFPDISTTAAVTRLANLQDTFHQPFFYPPSVSWSGNRGNRFLAVTLGSGNRTSPLLTSERNNFYMIRDKDIEKGRPAIANYPTVTAAMLHDATNNDIQAGTPEKIKAAETDLENKRGWKITLPNGEKSLSSILTLDGRVMATTFTPGEASTDDNLCGGAPVGLYYAMNVNDASAIDPVLDDAGSDNTGASDASKYKRSVIINTGVIPDGPSAVLTKDSTEGQVFVGREVVDTFERALTQVFWHAK